MQIGIVKQLFDELTLAHKDDTSTCETLYVIGCYYFCIVFVEKAYEAAPITIKVNIVIRIYHIIIGISSTKTII